MPARVLLSWSSGKDCAWALHVLRGQGADVAGLMTTFNERSERVAMHAVRRELVEAQAQAARLPLWPVMLPWPCSNADYEQRMAAVYAEARAAGITHVAFGDLCLGDIRAYREAQLAGSGLAPLFPLWQPRAGTGGLAREMLAAELRAVVTCVDPARIPAALCGHPYDETFLAALPAAADPCGEAGEFHTFCHAGPMFDRMIPFQIGPNVERDGFYFADVLPASDR